MRRARMPNRSLRIWGNLLLSAVLLSVYATSADVAHTGTDQSAQATQVSSSVYRGFAALCAVAKNENRYVREWVDHHKCLGFSRIYLYDHGSQERMSSQLEDHIASGFVSYTYFTGHHKKYSRDARPTSLEKFLLTAQGYAYKKCVKHHSKSHSFLGFIDIDEFLVLMDPGIVSVEQLLRPYSGFGGLAVHWQLTMRRSLRAGAVRALSARRATSSSWSTRPATPAPRLQRSSSSGSVPHPGMAAPTALVQVRAADAVLLPD
eukprot:XP_001698285.1 predicted protein [Chlamydomonas reinhardtii]